MSVPELADLKKAFHAAPFIGELGLELESISAGQCMTVLELQPRHLQQHGFVHAGVLATMADHTAGAAAFTLVTSGCRVVTAEFKISFLRAAQGEKLVCRATVLKPGRQFSFVESEVSCVSAGESRLVAKVSATMAVLADARE